MSRNGLRAIRREHKWSASRIAFERNDVGVVISPRTVTRLLVQIGLFVCLAIEGGRAAAGAAFALSVGNLVGRLAGSPPGCRACAGAAG